ncbi:DctP family TRAP transporter solute-binding subunit [Paenibacillus alkaliterrae]|uniref:DctP family TRAP transporter solute-binding subunit n=1 Tax=Paenibacillus alkaliterrae TaxID=320909 RepID=UPI001F28D668|nr:DctP family TRAP transporter solute-binding subunit [Paenibacillus alkaliterrae]MCF2937431.1 DctP family TRAP transporter solute-binding subunit [Paenibacillus alkaliterrae]
MKTWIGIGLFIVLGMFAAFLIGFRPHFTDSLPMDDEQTGLKDRIIIKFSHVVAENTPKGLAAEHFARLVKELSDDRVEIQVFPNGMLYSEDTEFAALQSGDIQMIAPSFSNMSVVEPAWLAMDLPFAFADQQAVDAALQGELGRRLFGTLNSHKVQGAAFWANGFKQMTSSVRPLQVPDDFRNQMFRILPSRLLVSQFQALGASTVKIPFNEVYGILKDGSADGQENTISNIVSKRLYQVQKYMTISNHGYLGYVVLFNKRLWADLSPEVQRVLQQALEETTAWINQETASMHEKQLLELKGIDGFTIHMLTEKERQQWIRKLEPLYDQYEQTIGSELMSEIGRPK